MGDGGLVVERVSAVAWLTIDRPERRNALDGDTTLELERALIEVDDDPSVRCIVITGSGDRAFSSGADLKEIEPPDRAADEVHRRRTALARVFSVVDQATTPVVCRVNGVAMGAGFGLAMAGDLVVADEDAWFSLPEVDVGRWPMAVGAMLLRHLPLRVTTELMMTGRRMGASEAYQRGALTAVVPSGALDEELAKVTEQLILKRADVLSFGRRTVRQMHAMSFAEALSHAVSEVDAVIDSDASTSAAQAFRERTQTDHREQEGIHHVEPASPGRPQAG